MRHYLYDMTLAKDIWNLLWIFATENTEIHKAKAQSLKPNLTGIKGMKGIKMQYEDITKEIIASCFQVSNELDIGFLELEKPN